MKIRISPKNFRAIVDKNEKLLYNSNVQTYGERQSAESRVSYALLGGFDSHSPHLTLVGILGIHSAVNRRSAVRFRDKGLDYNHEGERVYLIYTTLQSNRPASQQLAAGTFTFQRRVR